MRDMGDGEDAKLTKHQTGERTDGRNGRPVTNFTVTFSESLVAEVGTVQIENVGTQLSGNALDIGVSWSVGDTGGGLGVTSILINVFMDTLFYENPSWSSSSSNSIPYAAHI